MTDYRPRSIPHRFMTPLEVGELFRVDPKTVSRWVAAGKLPAIKTPGGHYRFEREDVDALLAEGAET